MRAISTYDRDMPPASYWDDEEDRRRAEEAYWADWNMKEEEAVERHYGI